MFTGMVRMNTPSKGRWSTSVSLHRFFVGVHFFSFRFPCFFSPHCFLFLAYPEKTCSENENRFDVKYIWKFWHGLFALQVFCSNMLYPISKLSAQNFRICVSAWKSGRFFIRFWNRWFAAAVSNSPLHVRTKDTQCELGTRFSWNLFSFNLERRVSWEIASVLMRNFKSL